MITVSTLDNLDVRLESGELLGRVFEVRAKGGEIQFLRCGRSGLLHRWAGQRGREIAWARVKQIAPREIVVTFE